MRKKKSLAQPIVFNERIVVRACFTFLLLSIPALGYVLPKEGFSEFIASSAVASVGFAIGEHNWTVESLGSDTEDKDFHSGNPMIGRTSFVALASVSITPEGYMVQEVYELDVTGYSSSVDETNERPYTTASNSKVRWGVVATNFPERENAIPFGTKVRIPRLFGDQIFVVEDRMNKRFTDRMDIWFPSKYEAVQFGVYRNIAVEVLEPLP